MNKCYLCEYRNRKKYSGVTVICPLTNKKIFITKNFCIEKQGKS